MSILVNKRAKGNKTSLRSLSLKLVRPALAIIIFILAKSLVNLSMDSADEYAREISKKIQQECKVKGECPEKIEGWEDSLSDWVVSQTLYGRFGKGTTPRCSIRWTFGYYSL